MTSAGAAVAAAFSASAPVHRLHDVVARRLERGPQEALDLRLVVDDEDALPAHASSGGVSSPMRPETAG